MRVIFLDIDGCLNDSFTVDRTPDGFYGIEAEKVERLNRIISATGAKVVVSSSWRIMHTLPEIEEFLREKGFSGEIVGMTPVGKKAPWESMRDRGDEILAWLMGNEAVESFVILDDADCDPFEEDRHVRTDWESGLDETVVARAIEVLNVPIDYSDEEGTG